MRQVRAGPSGFPGRPLSRSARTPKMADRQHLLTRRDTPRSSGQWYCEPALTKGTSLGARGVTLLVGVVALGALVRFPTIGHQSFWNDEAVTHGIVSQGLGHVLRTVPSTESTPPLYYVLVWLWSRAFGTHEAGLRSFSALCGTRGSTRA